jgi:hypothetical protein
MDLVAVVGGGVIASRLRARLEVNSLRGTQGFQHGIKPLPRPPQHTTKPMDRDPVGRRSQTVVRGPELLSEALRVQEPGQLFLLVEPVA